jgi:MFS family permease
MLGIACILWSAMTALSGFANSLGVLIITRIFLGVFEAAGNPAAYSLIADYFHPDYRTTANSIYSLGIYIGGALSSLTIIFITGLGWRWTYGLVGLIGIGSGVLGIIFVMEPIRGRYNIKTSMTGSAQPAVVKPSPLILFLRSAKEIFINPTCRWVLIAGSFRFFGGYAIGYYMPTYFG